MKSIVNQLFSNEALPDADAVRNALSDIPSDEGVFSIRESLSFILPEKAMESLDTILTGFSESKDMNSLLGSLSEIINAVPDDETKLVVAQKLCCPIFSRPST